MAEPTQMRAAQLIEFNQSYKHGLVARPRISENDLLVKVCAAGYCHSDLQVQHGQFGSKLPMIPSHEPAGIIVEVGARCTSEWKVGDRVGVLNFKKACSECPGCKLSIRQHGEADPRYCKSREMAGFSHDGAFCEYMIADPATTVKLPASLSHEQAAPLMCAGATVWGALEKATCGLPRGEAVGIIGIGGLGHLGIQFAKAEGYRTVAIDSRPEGRKLATEVANPSLAPDLVLDSTSPDAATEMLGFTNGEGLAAVIVCTDSLQANEWALTLLRMGGTCILLGLPPDKWRFDSSLIVFRELVLRGSYVASRKSTERMMAVVKQHNVQSFLTVIPFEEVASVTEKYLEKSFRGRLVVQIARDE